MINAFERASQLLGKDSYEILQKQTVAIFGLGGVGSFVVEALARCFIGNFILIDKDVLDESNLNRQIIATTKTVGRLKVEVAKERIQEINPKAKIKTYPIFYKAGDDLSFIDNCDYIVDAIDTISSKIALVEYAEKQQIPIISAMSAGNKLDPTKFEVADIYNTSVCPICKVMRKELKARNIPKLKVVYSKEKPLASGVSIGSVSFVPSVMGLIIAGEVIKDITNTNKK